jgi:hypothetical protein
VLCSSNIPSASLSTLSRPLPLQVTSRDHTPNISESSRDMARIKHVKRARPQAASPDESHAEDTTPAPPPRKRGRPRCSPTETDESHADNTTSVALPKKGRPHRVAVDTVQPVAPLTKHKAAPAAFPSLSHEQPLHVDVYLHHGLKQRVDASTDKDLEKCSEDMNAIYDNRCFPRHMNNEQRAWYEELKGRWLPDHVPVQVSGSRTTVTHVCSCVVVSGFISHD